jgi:hypothetical protein
MRGSAWRLRRSCGASLSTSPASRAYFVTMCQTLRSLRVEVRMLAKASHYS